MNDIAKLIPYPVDARISETATLLVASINFQKQLGHKQDAVAILATLLPRETLADFDWTTASVEDGGPGKKQTHVYYLRVRKRVVGVSGLLSPGRAAAECAHSTAHSAALHNTEGAAR